MMRNLLLFSTLWLTASYSIAQEKLTVMHYNLTYYGQTSGNCTSSTNNITTKDGNLNTIIDEVQPDVFTVNELGVSMVGGENLNATRILDNVLNDNGEVYAKAAHTGSYICNMLYYNKSKLQLKNQTAITKDANNNDLVREIDFYTLYYKDADLATHNDTIYMTFIVAHLKAGDTSTDSTDRARATLAAMNYINTNNIRGNVFFMGDFNTYSSDDGLVQNIVNYTTNQAISFVDPIDQLGDWNSNYWDYGAIYTQSTRDNNNTNSNCFSGGGMDDRFDIIFMSKDVKDNLSGVKYVADSYKAFGQDGSMTNNNSALNTTSNSVVSNTIAQALFDMSDHLPVVMEIEVHTGALGIKNEALVSQFQMNNPVSNELLVKLQTVKPINQATLEITNIAGQTIAKQVVYVNGNNFSTSVNTHSFAKGLYLIKLTDEAGTKLVVNKFVKQ